MGRQAGKRQGQGNVRKREEKKKKRGGGSSGSEMGFGCKIARKGFGERGQPEEGKVRRLRKLT